MEAVRWIALTALILFTAYTIYATKTENFWKSCKTVWRLRWGRQFIADLYIGLFLFTFIIYLNENSIWITLAWMIPTLALGNIVPLIYLFLNFDTLVWHFI